MACVAREIVMKTEPWALILAGGSGWRLQRLTEMITGGPRPKQFCPLMDGETPLDRTRRRADLLVRGDRQAVVVTRKHEAHYRYLREELAPGRLVVQPSDRGTGPGIVYPLLRILELAGNVPVAVLPSDHYVADDSAFMGHIERALGCLDGVPYAVVLLGAEPTYAEVEYGWIEPAVDPVMIDGESVFGIRRFWEKPSAAQAERLLGRRCLWNTFVMVGWARALIDLVGATCPDLIAPFRRARAALNSPGEDAALERVYAELPSVNFSRSVLAAAPGSLGVIRLAGTDWSDWGNVRRVVESLRGSGRRPSWLAQAESMLIA
jgi:mannose-1-phosphate guanylyltransferase